MQGVRVRVHQWVKHIQVPVDVVVDPITDEPTIVTDPDKMEAAFEHGVHGCAACSVPLNSDTAKTNCPGSDPSL